MSKDDDGMDGSAKPFVLRDLSDLDGSVSAGDLAAAHGAFAAHREKATDIALGGYDATEGLAKLAMGLSGSNHLKSITDGLMDQQRNIDRLLGGVGTPLEGPKYRLPKLPPIPPNPIHETNNRLARIEKQFELMQSIATQGAQIATSLQAYAAEFLAKFEAAASSTERSADKAVRLSMIAIALTVLTALAPFAYQVWRAPADTAANEAIVAQLRAEIEQLRRTQADTADRIEAALKGNGEATLEVLREMQRSTAVASPGSTPRISFNPKGR